MFYLQTIRLSLFQKAEKSFIPCVCLLHNSEQDWKPLDSFFLHIWAAVLYQFNMIKYINLKPEQLNKTVLNNKKKQSHVTRAFWKQTDLVFLHTRCVTAPRYWLRYMLSSSDSLHINEWVIINDSHCWKRQPTLLNSINQLFGTVCLISRPRRDDCNPKSTPQSQFLKELLKVFMAAPWDSVALREKRSVSWHTCSQVLADWSRAALKDGAVTGSPL